MRPVSSAFPINQPFGGMKTAGVVGDISRPDTVEYYVAKYGNYQPYGHAGTDIACPEGTPVVAIAAGTVLWADWGTNLPGDASDWGYRQRWYLYKGFPGIVTVIQHDGWVGVYAHLSQAFMNTGDRVKEGQRIGLSGSTGGVAPHLHVEALVDMNFSTGGGLIYGRTDPSPYFGSGGAAIGPQGTITKPIQEDTLSAAEVKQINEHASKQADRVIEYVGQLMVSGYKVGDQKFAGATKVDIVNQQLIKTVISLLQRPDLTAADITAAVQAGLSSGIVTVDVNVAGKQ